MTVTIELDEELQNRFLADARAQGISLEDYLAGVITNSVAPVGAQDLTEADFEAGLNELADGCESLPVLPPEAFSRDSFYGDD